MDNNLDFTTEPSQTIHESVNREATEASPEKVRDLRLVESHNLSSLNLRKPTHTNRVLNQLDEVRLPLLEHRIFKPEVLEHVA
jgi:hypothetical protein